MLIRVLFWGINDFHLKASRLLYFLYSCRDHIQYCQKFFWKADATYVYKCLSPSMYIFFSIRLVFLNVIACSSNSLSTVIFYTFISSHQHSWIKYRLHFRTVNPILESILNLLQASQVLWFILEINYCVKAVHISNTRFDPFIFQLYLFLFFFSAVLCFMNSLVFGEITYRYCRERIC